MVDQSARVRDVVGGKTDAVLEKAFDIHTAGDLLRHYPRRYYERGELTDLSALRVGEQVTIQVKVVKVSGRQIRREAAQDRHHRDRRHRRSCSSRSSTGNTWPARSSPTRRSCWPARSSASATGCSSSSRRSRSTPIGFLDDAGTLMPVYPATKALPTWSIRKAIRTALDMVDVPETAAGRAPQGARLDRARPGAALDPPAGGLGARSRWRSKRLRFDEAFVLQVVLAQRRHAGGARAGDAAGAARRRPARGVRRAAAVHPDRRVSSRSPRS